jgi:hypothetical protein
MRRGVAGGAAVIPILLALLARRAPAMAPDKIDLAIHNAKAFLYSKQKNGNWEVQPTAPTEAQIKKSPSSMNAGQWGEQTALVTFALLAGGDGPQDDKLIEPIKFLKDSALKGVYALGIKAQIYPFLPPTADRKIQASADAARLTGAQLDQGAAKGLYSYLVDTKDIKRFDHSVSLYGVLGVWACERAGAEISEGYWKSVEEAWIRDQDVSGAWAPGRRPSGKGGLNVSMTAAGLTAMYMTQDHLHAAIALQSRGNISDPYIDLGLNWLTRHFDRVLTESSQRYSPFSTLFDVERVGMASGLKYFGSVDWYDIGTDYLVKTQSPDGSWGGSLPATCYAILFLSHGQAPMVFNKLQYEVDGKAGNWNQRPRDVANTVDWIAREIEGVLNWQIVDMKTPLLQLHDAPILYLAGNQSLKFTTEQEQKLREYCEEGGIILANADDGASDFANSFRALGTTLFPEYEFRELPAEHPIYTNEQWKRNGWKTVPTVLSLSNGVREMMVLMPTTDPARSWQLNEAVGHEEPFQFADNLFLYATGKENLQEKGKTYVIYPDERIHPSRNITIARLQYDGNWDPEPAGWRRLAAILHNSFDISLTIVHMKLGSGALSDGANRDVKLAHLTGTTRVKLDAAEQGEIRKFVESGGTLIVDAAGGSQEFGTSIEGQLAGIFGPAASLELKQRLASTDAVYNLPVAGITEFNFRPFTRKIIGNIQGPQLRAIHLHGRSAVFYSPEDLSAGLVGAPIDGIIGYEPSTATEIMRNLLLSAGLPSDIPTKPLTAIEHL